MHCSGQFPNILQIVYLLVLTGTSSGESPLSKCQLLPLEFQWHLKLRKHPFYQHYHPCRFNRQNIQQSVNSKYTFSIIHFLWNEQEHVMISLDYFLIKFCVYTCSIFVSASFHLLDCISSCKMYMHFFFNVNYKLLMIGFS